MADIDKVKVGSTTYNIKDSTARTAAAGKSPTNHRSTETTYGVANNTYYGHVKVDSALSTSSTNPVRNSVVTDKLESCIYQRSVGGSIWPTLFLGVNSGYSAMRAINSGSPNNVNTTWSCSVDSDERVKINIKDSSVNALDIINHLEPKEFDYIKSLYGKHTDLGFIAQNIEEYIPEAVINSSQADNQVDIELKSLAYERIVPYLIKAIQELQQQIIDLREEN